MVPPQLTDEERRLFEELAAASTFDPRRRSMTYATRSASTLARPCASDLESFAAAARAAPDLVRRLVALGLLEPHARRRRPAAGSPRAQLAARRPDPAAARRAVASTTPPSASCSTCSTASPSSRRLCAAAPDAQEAGQWT